MNEKLKELWKIMEENPDLEVIFFMENDDLSNCGFTNQDIFKIAIEPLLENERGDLIDYEQFIDGICDDENMQYEEAEIAYPIKNYQKYISVYLH